MTLSGHESRNQTRLAVAAALVVFGLVVVTLRRGVELSPDGWSYWQASVSMLEGDGYRDFFGLAIDAWPPLYPTWLMIVQGVLGVSGRTLAVATGLLAALSVLAWAALLGAYARRAEASPRAGLCLVGLLLVLNARSLHSEHVVHVVFPLLLLIALRVQSDVSAVRFVRRAWLASLCLGIALCTRNAAIALIPALALVFAAARRHRLGTRVAAALIVTLPPILVWLGLRAWLDQLDSFPIGFGLAKETLSTYLYQCLRGLGRSVSLDGIGQVLLAVLAIAMWRGRGRVMLGLVATTLAALLLVFNLCWIADSLDKRFVLFVPLALGGLGLVELRGLLRPPARILVVVALFAQPTIRVAEHAVLGRGPAGVDPRPEAAQGFVPSDARIEPGFVRRRPQRRDDGVVLSPPLYPWQRARLEDRRGR